MMKLSTMIISGAIVTSTLAANAADKPAAMAPAAAAEKAAPPATPMPMPMPTPPPELDTLFKSFEGSWKCDTTFPAGAMGPGSPEVKTKSEVKIKKESNGFWYKGEYKIKKSKTMPGFAGTFLLGYDAAAKAPISLNFDDMGGYAVEMAGPATDKIVMSGESHMMGMKGKIRETMSAKDKGLEHTMELDLGKGFTAMGTDVCKK